MAYIAYALIRLWSHQLRTTGLEIPPEFNIFRNMRGIKKDALRRKGKQGAVVVVVAAAAV
jgi:hypothetical protein